MRVLLLLLAVILTGPVYAEELPSLPPVVTPSLSEDVATDTLFAEKLEEQGEVRGALIEWQRIIYESDDLDEQEKAAFNVARLYQKLGEYGKALNFSQRFIKKYPESDYTPEVLYRMSVAAEKLKDNGAAFYVQDLRSNHPDSKWTAAAEYHYYWQRAKSGSFLPDANGVSQRELKHRLDTHLPRSPKAQARIAATLSVLPGVGLVYAGEWQTALGVMLASALLAWALWHAGRHRHIPYAAIWGVLLLTLLFLSMARAYHIAEDNHHKKRLQLLMAWEDLYPLEP